MPPGDFKEKRPATPPYVREDMLHTLRNVAGTWVAKLLLILLVLSFAVWGISGSILGGVGGNTVLSAGDTRVSTIDYRLAYDRQLMIYGQRFGQRITREQAAAFGIDQQVLGQLIAGAVLDEQSNRLGLGMSVDRLASLIAEDEAFHGPDGNFSQQQFDFVLRQVGMRPEDYLRNREQVAMRQQIVEAVADGLVAPDAFLRAVALYQGETRTVDHVTILEASVGEIADPAGDVLSRWFDERKADYAAPEYRKLSYVKLAPEDIADPSSVSDDDVRKDYEAKRARYTTPETRTIQQLAFTSTEAAEAALARIRGGESFEDVVAAEGKTMSDVELGTFTKDRVPDQRLADAAFALDQGSVSDVVAGGFGPVILRVSATTPETTKPLDEVRDQIRQDLALAEANRILLEVHDAYEDARAGGATMEEAAAAQKLEVTTIEAVDRSGQRPDQTVVDNLPESVALLRAAFETEVGIENPAIHMGSNGYVFYEIAAITPARERTLDEVRDRVLADWKAAERQSRLSAKAEEFRKRIEDGASFDSVAVELGLEKQTKRGLKRDADDADFGDAGVEAAFALPQGKVGTATAPGDNGGRILFQVVEVLEPAGAGADAVPDDLKQTFSSGMADDLLDQLVVRLRGEYGVEVNEAAIRQALSF